jgi:SAM-dependent methyltransferase
MSKDQAEENRSPTRHLALRDPSPWVLRFAGQVPAGGRVLDLACGGGRHTRLFLDLGHPVLAMDRDIAWVSDLAGRPDLETLEADLEDGRPFPLAGQRFAGVVVTNYLYRPILSALVESVAPGGVLIYETFSRGNERFGRPSNPAHLLEPGELLGAVRGSLRILAYEDLDVEQPKPAAVQRICAARESPESP